MAARIATISRRRCDGNTYPFGEGTEAASEVVSNQAYLDAVLEKAPKNWDQLNLEAIVEANVIEGHPGPPTVVAVRTW